MTPAVSREEINLPAMHSPADDGIGWITERRFDSVFCRFLHPFHLVKATSPDDADGRRTSSHSARLNWNGPTRASLTVVCPLARNPPLCHNPLSQMPKFFIKTYGCQMNERDSEQVVHALLERGYERAAGEADADVILLNTCSVRDMAEKKALGKMGMLGQIAKRRPETVFGFLGCMAQARGQSLFAAVPHSDLCIGTQN